MARTRDVAEQAESLDLLFRVEAAVCACAFRLHRLVSLLPNANDVGGQPRAQRDRLDCMMRFRHILRQSIDTQKQSCKRKYRRLSVLGANVRWRWGIGASVSRPTVL